jgi:hypothetical protein
VIQRGSVIFLSPHPHLQTAESSRHSSFRGHDGATLPNLLLPKSPQRVEFSRPSS